MNDIEKLILRLKKKVAEAEARGEKVTVIGVTMSDDDHEALPVPEEN